MRKEVKYKECADKSCQNEFKPFKTTDKYCSSKCFYKNTKPLKKSAIVINKENRKKHLQGLREKVMRNSTDIKSKAYKSAFKSEFDRQRGKIKKRLRREYGCLVCEKCGTTRSIQFSTHHIVYRSEKPSHSELNNLRNLIHLCFDCHEGYHKDKKSRNNLIKDRNLTGLFGNLWGYNE